MNAEHLFRGLKDLVVAGAHEPFVGDLIEGFGFRV